MRHNREYTVRGFVREVTERIMKKGQHKTLILVAEKVAEVHYQTLLKWRSGERTPEIANLDKMLNYLRPGLKTGDCLLLPDEVSRYREYEAQSSIDHGGKSSSGANP